MSTNEPKNELPTAYDPKAAETTWYDVWEERGYFKPRLDASRPFCIMIPPPNITGSLHVGHALNNTLQDILARWRRMEGDDVLWQPGTDHAGIATQKIVSDRVRDIEKKTRLELGREEFLKRVWAWKEESGGTIVRQLKRLGSSCDWSRERFTMDEGLSRAVRQAFVGLFQKNLLQRDFALTNWCPGTCKTVLSDLEVEHEEVAARKYDPAKPDYQSAGRLYHIKYPLEKAVGAVTHISVATTRPETMLGDTAVAVNPEDDRYTALVKAGARVKLPLTDRVIPVVADSYVDKAFGSGVVKITPAHDPNDFEVGKRHKLPQISIFDDDAKVNANGFAYAGVDRYQARKKILADLEAQGLLEKIEGHAMSVGHCQRCQTVVEPMLSTQWFVRTKTLAAAAMTAVREKKTRIIPEQQEAQYFRWMEN
ncbi:MAG TPA: class I tRNA ligase family protein, partial [bacterium]|nr:class I tRNA ligase family protein [bacterium]